MVLGTDVPVSCEAWAQAWRTTSATRARSRPTPPAGREGTSVKLFDVVETLVDIPRIDVVRGMSGTIVEIYTEPSLGYEVEFVYEGQTDLLLETLTPSQVRLVWSAP